jgi:DNA-binding MarR family transcriptional regulator
MHQVLFSVKRTFHKSTWFGRGLLAGFTLTPSRFDVLFILKETRAPHVWQSTLWKIMGVSAATASIMIRALVRLGFLRREKSKLDGRQLEVSLTDLGRTTIARASGALRDNKVIDYFVRRIVSSTWWNAEQSFADIDQLVGTLRHMRTWLKDKALLAYAYDHPDD